MRTLQVHFPSGKEVLGRYWGMLRGGGLRLDLPMLPQALPELDSDWPEGPERSEWPHWKQRASGRPGTSPAAVSPVLAAADRTTAAAEPDALTLLPVDTKPGEQLRLQVHVRTIKKTFPVLAQLLDLTRLPSGLRAVVGFLPESPPDELLDAVWADGLNVPQRRTRRHAVRVPVRFACVSGGDSSLRPGELRNVSLGGCCIAGLALPALGSHVMVQVPEEALAGSGIPYTSTLHLSGRVRWTERPATGLMGIEFQSTSSALAEFLRALPPAGRLPYAAAGAAKSA